MELLLAFQLEVVNISKVGGKTKIQFKATIGNRGPGRSQNTAIEVMVKKKKIASLNVKPLGPKEVYTEAKLLEVVVSEGDEIEAVLGGNIKIDQESNKENNVVRITTPLAPDTKIFRAPKVSTRVVMLQDSKAKDYITGFSWAKDGQKMVITAGARAHLFALKNVTDKEGNQKTKIACIPVLQAPPGAFFGRPKFFGDKILVTSYSKTKKPKNEGLKRR